MPNLNDYLNSINQQNQAIQALPGQRNQGISKIKADSGYDEKMRNLEGINKQVFQTQQMLEDLPKNLQTQLRGRNVSNAQLQGLTGAKQQPLSQSLGRLSRTADTQQMGINNVNKQIDDFRNSFNSDFQTRLQGMGAQSEALFKKYQADNDTYQREMDRKFQADQARAAADLQRRLAAASAPSMRSMSSSGSGRDQLGGLADLTDYNASSRSNSGANNWLRGAGQAFNPMSSGWNDIYKNPKAAGKSVLGSLGRLNFQNTGGVFNYLNNLWK